MHRYLVKFFITEPGYPPLFNDVIVAENWIDAHNRVCNNPDIVENRQNGVTMDFEIKRLDRDNAKTVDYDLITYDVWGNKRDGYSVNQSFRTGKVIKVPEWLLDQRTPKDDYLFLRLLKEQGVLMPYVQVRHIEWEGENDYTLYARRVSDSMPLFELQNRKVHE